VHIFVTILCYSRALFVAFTVREMLSMLVSCHAHAFNWFGEVAKELLYDNFKTVVLRRDATGRQITLNPQF
jgi:transposase